METRAEGWTASLPAMKALTAARSNAGRRRPAERLVRPRAATAVPRAPLPLAAYQEEHQEGPCVSACRRGELQIAPELSAARGCAAHL